MADIAFSSVEKIFKVVAEIKEAVDTAKQNREEVFDIQERVETVGDVVLELEEADVTKNLSMDRALANLHKTLHRALELVKECEKQNMMCLLCTARDLSKQLLKVQDDISCKLLQVTLATTVHITKRLGMKANPTRRRRRRRRPASRPPRPQVPSEGTEFNIDDGHSTGGASGRFQKSENKVETKVEDLSMALSGFKMFSLSELKAATNNFSNDNKIGEDSFSTVYKGLLQDGLVVAVKVSTDPETRMLDEVNICAKLKHKNVVKHLGYCVETASTMRPLTSGGMRETTHFLVLDYLPNGTLQHIIDGEKPVDLSSCFRIIQEIAQVVHYLHEQRVIHADLKPDYIAFDTLMNPVITDFGLSKVLEPDVDEEIFDSLVGTLGYMAPETIWHGGLSMKSNVFSFGVSLIKTIIILSTGKHDLPIDAEAWNEALQKARGLKGLLDPTIQVDESQLMQINRYLEVGWLCIDIDPSKRPTMADVVVMLSGEKKPPTPKNRCIKGSRA